VQPAGQAVDVVVGPERLADLVDVLFVQLLRIVELVAVDLLVEPVDRPAYALHGRLAGTLRLVATRNEPCDHRAEGPDAEARLHARSVPRAVPPVRVDERHPMHESFPSIAGTN
jgi:hypothetical protein